MKVCYDNLWKILIEKKMNKTDLLSLTQMGSATLAKLSKNKIVSLETKSPSAIGFSSKKYNFLF